MEKIVVKSFAVVYCPNEKSEDEKYVGSVSDYTQGGCADPILMTKEEADALVDELTKYVDAEVIGNTEMENQNAHDAFDWGDWGFKVEQVLTYDVQFQNDTMSDSKGFSLTAEECMDYINLNNGTNDSYFKDYKGGMVQVVCNETGDVVAEEEVR